MKSLILIASLGLALAALVSVQALRPGERAPVTPIEVRTQTEQSDNEPAQTAGTPTARSETTKAELAAPRRPRRELPSSETEPDNRTDDRGHARTPPSGSSDDADEDEPRIDDE